jgi:hypothetical protein
MPPLTCRGPDGLGFSSSCYERVGKGRAAFTAKSKRWDVLFAALGAAQQELSTAFATELSVGRVFAAAIRAAHIGTPEMNELNGLFVSLNLG